MPPPPEVRHAVIIRHAPYHILRRIYPIEEGPEAKKPPGEKQLQPYVFEVEEAEHGELGGGVEREVGAGVENGDHVHEVDHYFHGEEADGEAEGVEGGAAGGYAERAVAQLGGVVVEG